MNSAREFIEYYQKESGRDLFEDIQLQGFDVGIFGINSEKELDAAIVNDREGIEKSILALLSCSVKNNKREISDTRFIIAVKESLINSFTTGRSRRYKNSYISDFVYTDDECYSIMKSYHRFHENPLAFLICKELGVEKRIYSLYEGTLLEGAAVATYGENRSGKYFKFRIASQNIADFNYTKINKAMYHPIIWYILKRGNLKDYLTTENLKLIKNLCK